MTPKEQPVLDPAIEQTLQEVGEMIIAGRLVQAPIKPKKEEDGEAQ